MQMKSNSAALEPIALSGLTQRRPAAPKLARPIQPDVAWLANVATLRRGELLERATWLVLAASTGAAIGLSFLG